MERWSALPERLVRRSVAREDRGPRSPKPAEYANARIIRRLGGQYLWINLLAI
jgi:hypothetical protein